MSPSVLSLSIAVSVNASAESSAYAARILAASVASLAFSSCDVKIGILIATKTPMIATCSSSSASRNFIVILSHTKIVEAGLMIKRSDEFDLQ